MAANREEVGKPSGSGVRAKRACRRSIPEEDLLTFLDTSDIEISEEEDEWLPESTQNIVSDSSDADVNEEGQEDEIEKEEETAQSTQSKKKKWKWNRSTSFRYDSDYTVPDYVPDNERLQWSPTKYFSQYIKEDIYTLIAEETNRRTVLETGKSLNLTMIEIKNFTGISIATGVLKYPRLRMYWAKSYAIPLISNTMSRDRYFKIRCSLKMRNDLLVTEEEKKSDRLWKMRPLINAIKTHCNSLPRSKEVCVDEQMVPFTGRCGIKQYVPNKPRPEGLKIFVLANPTGLITNFEIYQGKAALPCTGTDSGLRVEIVLHLVTILGPGHSLFCDRYFTGLNLMDELLKKGITCTGTMVKKRVPSYCNLKEEKELKKTGRGSFDQVVREDGKVALVRWMDKKATTLGSTEFAAEPLNECKRWSKKDRQYMDIKRPDSVKRYNESMGGVDLHDRMLSFYPMLYRTKKWTVRLFHHLIDLAITNSWLEYRMDRLKLGIPQKQILQLFDFKILIAEDLSLARNKECPPDEINDDIETEVTEKTKRGRPTSLPHKKERQFGQHIPEFVEMATAQKRCRYPGCKSRPRTMCIQCNIYLCVNSNNCFKKFHS